MNDGNGNYKMNNKPGWNFKGVKRKIKQVIIHKSLSYQRNLKALPVPLIRHEHAKKYRYEYGIYMISEI